MTMTRQNFLHIPPLKSPNSFINFKLMKYKIIRLAFFLVLLGYLSSCGHKDLRHRTYKAKYRKAGRYW